MNRVGRQLRCTQLFSLHISAPITRAPLPPYGESAGNMQYGILTQMEWQLLSARVSTFNINKGVFEQLKRKPLSALKSSQVHE